MRWIRQWASQRIANKLLLLVVLNGVGFVLIVAIDWISFSSVERMSADATQNHMADVIRHWQEEDTLEDVRLEIELLSRALYVQDEALSAEGQTLIRRLESLAAGAETPDLKASISELSLRLSAFLENSRQIKALLEERASIDRAIYADLTALETLISKNLIEFTLRGQNTASLGQGLSLVTGYRESLLLIGRMLSEVARASVATYDGKIGTRIIKVIDDLHLRMQTITASEPGVALYGRNITDDVERYRRVMLKLHAELLEHKTFLRGLRVAENNATSFLEEKGGGIAEEIDRASKKISKIVGISTINETVLFFVLFSAMSLSIIIIIRRSITAPLKQIIAGIDTIRDGHLDRPVRLGREDEWGTIENALNNMSGELKKSYAALRESEARYRVLVENQSDMIVKLDLEGRLLFASPTYCETFGETQEELLGQPLMALVPEDGRSATGPDMEVLRHPPHTYNLEQREMTQNGWRWLAWAFRAVLDDSGQIVATIGVGRDITERKEMEKRLHRSQHMEAIGNLAGGVSHEFNNLLMAISGNLYLLEDSLQEDESARSLVARAEQAVMRGKDLTSRLLAYSRKQRLQPAITDVSEVVSAIIKLADHTLGRTIVLDPVLAEGLWPCNVDRGQLEGAVLNLLANSRDALPQGGKIIVETANVHLDTRPPGVGEQFQPGDYVKVIIRDTGVGMSPEVLDKAINPFFTTKEVGKGTGLGLSMVHGFARQSGGDVSLASDVGRGTTVTIYLPRASDAEGEDFEEAGKEREERQRLQGSETILLVEDDDDVRVPLSAMLEEGGCRVVCATDAASAFAILKSDQSIDVLLTDILLPGGVDGWKLAELARGLRPDLKVLYTTGHPEKTKPMKGTPPVPGQVLTKPYRKQDLIDALRTPSNT